MAHYSPSFDKQIKSTQARCKNLHCTYAAFSCYNNNYQRYTPLQDIPEDDEPDGPDCRHALWEIIWAQEPHLFGAFGLLAHDDDPVVPQDTYANALVTLFTVHAVYQRLYGLFRICQTCQELALPLVIQPKLPLTPQYK